MKRYEQTFIIDRSKWRTGGTGNQKTGKGNTLLLNGEGYMCCLGMVGEQLEVPRSCLLNIGTPSEVSTYEIPYLQNLLSEYSKNSELSSEAMAINDDILMSRKDREVRLKKLFNDHNLNLKFIGRYEL